MNESQFIKQFNDLVEDYCSSDEFEDVFEGYNSLINGKEFCISIQVFNSKEGGAQ